MQFAGLLAGVITKTDIVAKGRGIGDERDVVLCESKDLLHDVWMRMKARDLKMFLLSIGRLGPWDFSTYATFCKCFSMSRRTKKPCCGTT